MQGNQWLSNAVAYPASKEGSVPLSILVTESNHDHIGLRQQRLCPNSIHFRANLVPVGAFLLHSENDGTTVVTVFVARVGRGE
jgi:hypothetical protein